MKPVKENPVWFATLTHAKIRAGQGDRSGARQVLREVLKREPWNREARNFFDQLAGRDRTRSEVRTEPVQEPPQEATAEELSDRFRKMLESDPEERIGRLNAWLGRISGGQGEDDAG